MEQRILPTGAKFVPESALAVDHELVSSNQVAFCHDHRIILQSDFQVFRGMLSFTVLSGSTPAPDASVRNRDCMTTLPVQPLKTALMLGATSPVKLACGRLYVLYRQHIIWITL